MEQPHGLASGGAEPTMEQVYGTGFKLPPWSESLTAQAAHKKFMETGYMDPALRWRATFAPGGQLCFGARVINVASLGDLDAACKPKDDHPAATKARAEAALQVAAGAEAGASSAATLAAYKEAAVVGDAPPPASALTEQHIWKLAAALFLPLEQAEERRRKEREGGLSSFVSDGGAQEALQCVREREALRAWLRLALWDHAALECGSKGGGGEEEEDDDELSAKIFALLASCHDTEAVAMALKRSSAPAAATADAAAEAEPAEESMGAEEAGGSGGGVPRAYLAAIMAQPASNVRSDMQAHIGRSNPHLLAPPLRKVFNLQAGGEWEEEEEGGVGGGGGPGGGVAGGAQVREGVEGVVAAHGNGAGGVGAGGVAGFPRSSWLKPYAHDLSACRIPGIGEGLGALPKPPAVRHPQEQYSLGHYLVSAPSAYRERGRGAQAGESNPHASAPASGGLDEARRPRLLLAFVSRHGAASQHAAAADRAYTKAIWASSRFARSPTPSPITSRSAFPAPPHCRRRASGSSLWTRARRRPTAPRWPPFWSAFRCLMPSPRIN